MNTTIKTDPRCLTPIPVVNYLPDEDRARIMSILSKFKKATLIEYCKEMNYKKYSKYNKKELVLWILDKMVENS